MALLKGIPVTLYDRVQTGTDAFHAPVYTETAVTVRNVLVCPVDSGDIVTEQQLRGKHEERLLCIPREDRHQWEGCRVDFDGARWQAVGFVQEWTDANVPGPWNRRIRVERYG